MVRKQRQHQSYFGTQVYRGEEPDTLSSFIRFKLPLSGWSVFATDFWR
jgi:hypothetical protein